LQKIAAEAGGGAGASASCDPVMETPQITVSTGSLRRNSVSSTTPTTDKVIHGSLRRDTISTTLAETTFMQMSAQERTLLAAEAQEQLERLLEAERLQKSMFFRKLKEVFQRSLMVFNYRRIGGGRK